MGEQGFDDREFMAEAGQQCEVHVQRDPGFPPTLHRNSTDETRTPTAVVTEVLDLPCGFEQADETHLRSLAKWCCISTSPEVTLSGWVPDA